ncbi:group I intron-associated PD-(D/E)XK endonuclease [Haloarchaeobius amylolyticus]|uniref:group I intron-associated PD-(D/E)XK endonuclease n=1 Tax=Haloarchaeobius amylolyticus TaxID=1198296 RepID=UPI00226F01E5
MNTSRKGDETEALVLAELMRLGLSVSVPFGDSDRYDLIVDDGDRLHRVQCKTGSWVNGTVRFNLYSSTVGSDGRVDVPYSADQIDAYAVHSRETGDAYWVPVTETGDGEMRLRVDDPQPKAPLSRVNWASEFLVERYFGGRPSRDR